MRDLKRDWQEIRAMQAALPPFVWLVSVEHEMNAAVGGRMVQVAAANGAQLLHGKSHRLALDGEIAAHLEDQEAIRRQTLHERLQRSGVAVVAIPLALPPRSAARSIQRAVSKPTIAV